MMPRQASQLQYFRTDWRDEGVCLPPPFNVGYALPLLGFLLKLRNSEACDLRCGHHRLAIGNGTKVPGRRALAAACMHSAPPGSMRKYTKLEPRRRRLGSK